MEKNGSAHGNSRSQLTQNDQGSLPLIYAALEAAYTRQLAEKAHVDKRQSEMEAELRVLEDALTVYATLLAPRRKAPTIDLDATLSDEEMDGTSAADARPNTQVAPAEASHDVGHRSRQGDATVDAAAAELARHHTGRAAPTKPAAAAKAATTSTSASVATNSTSLRTTSTAAATATTSTTAAAPTASSPDSLGQKPSTTGGVGKMKTGTVVQFTSSLYQRIQHLLQSGGCSLKELDKIVEYICKLVEQIDKMTHSSAKDRVADLNKILGAVTEMFRVLLPSKSQLVHPLNKVRIVLRKASTPKMAQLLERVDTITASAVITGILPEYMDIRPAAIRDTWSVLTLLDECDSRNSYTGLSLPRWRPLFLQRFEWTHDQHIYDAASSNTDKPSLPHTLLLVGILTHVAIQLAPQDEVTALGDLLAELQAVYKGSDSILRTYHLAVADPELFSARRQLKQFDLEEEAAAIRRQLGWLYKTRSSSTRPAPAY